MLDVIDLEKSYYGKTAVDRVSFSVGDGEILGFLGPNGAGKTTTMRMITGFLPPTSGSVKVDGIDIQERPLDAKRLLGYLPETLALYPDMRVREYVKFRASLEGLGGREADARTGEAIETCFVSDVADTPIANLSKGYRQRVGLAAALVHKPRVLVLDEPTVGLDPRQIVKIRDLIGELRKGHSILLSTHILPEVELVCDRVLIIDRGRIVAEGTPDTLRHQLAQTPGLTVAIRGEVTDADDVLRALPGVKHAARIGAGGETRVVLDCAKGVDIREAVFREAVAKGWTLLELSPRQASLEDVFVRLLATEPQDTLPTMDAALPAAEEADGEHGHGGAAS